MGPVRSASSADRRRGQTPRRHGNHPAGGRGFVLLYALWILTAITLVLATLSARQRTLARATTAQLEEALVNRQLLNVLDFVLQRSEDIKVDLDPRLLQFEQLREAEQSGETQGQDVLEGLRQILPAELMQQIESATSKPPAAETTKGAAASAEQGESITVAGELKRLYYASQDDFTLELDERVYSIRVWPINARPSLNTLSQAALQRYLSYLGLGEEAAARLAGALTDWRDADRFTTESGAEADAYQRKGYAPRNGPFRSWQEVYYVKGASAALVGLLRRHFVIHGEHRQVYAPLLSPEALASLAGVSEQDAALALAPAPGGSKPGWKNELPPEVVRKIKAVSTDEADEDTLLVRIQRGVWSVQATYAWKEKRLLELSLDGSGPVDAIKPQDTQDTQDTQGDAGAPTSARPVSASPSADAL